MKGRGKMAKKVGEQAKDGRERAKNDRKMLIKIILWCKVQYQRNGILACSCSTYKIVFVQHSNVRPECGFFLIILCLPVLLLTKKINYYQSRKLIILSSQSRSIRLYKRFCYAGTGNPACTVRATKLIIFL
jgi:hypothetical protein